MYISLREQKNVNMCDGHTYIQVDPTCGYNCLLAWHLEWGPRAAIRVVWSGCKRVEIGLRARDRLQAFPVGSRHNRHPPRKGRTRFSCATHQKSSSGFFSSLRASQLVLDLKLR